MVLGGVEAGGAENLVGVGRLEKIRKSEKMEKLGAEARKPRVGWGRGWVRKGGKILVYRFGSKNRGCGERNGAWRRFS